MKLIDVDMLCKYCDNNINHSITPNEIMRMPFVDAEPVKHGRWIGRRNGMYYCSNCGREERQIVYQKNYCSNCGAKMDLKDGEHE
jgi:DNA-directed RNA polymerase subunit RPC12/RpoP